MKTLERDSMPTSCVLSFFEVKGRPYDVKALFLEDILRTTGYTNKEMAEYKAEMQKGDLSLSLFFGNVFKDLDLIFVC